MLAIGHVIVVLHGHVEFVAGWLTDTESLGADVAAAHDDPAVAMFGVLLGKAEIELGVEVFGGMDAHLQPARGDVFAELSDAFIDVAAVVRLAHIAQEAFAVLFYRRVAVAEKHLPCGLGLTEEVVDVDADKNLYFLCRGEFLPELEIPRRTEKANHGMEDVEVGHG